MNLRSASLRLGLAVPIALLVAGCGEKSSDEPAGDRRSGPVTQVLPGEPATDSPVAVGVDGDDVLVATVSDRGVLQTHLSVAGAAFVDGTALRTGEKYVGLADPVRLADGSWYLIGSGGMATRAGDEEMLFEPTAFRSDDGLVWDPVTPRGIDGAVDINSAVVFADQIVVTGSERTLGDPSMGGFEARIWTSTDGATYAPATVPDVPVYSGYKDESYVGPLVVAPDGNLLAAGRVGRQAAMWTSSDGAGWTSVDAPAIEDAYSIDALVSAGGSVLATVAGRKRQAISSPDSGETWQGVEALGRSGEDDEWMPLWSTHDAFLTLQRAAGENWSSPAVCYADLAQCSNQPAPQLLLSEEGVDWHAVDASVDADDIDDVFGTEDGRMLLLARTNRNQVVVHSWRAADRLPSAAADPTPKTVDLTALREGSAPEVGVRYAFPLYTHCGISTIMFGETWWARTDDGPGYETGAGDEAPAGWPIPPGGGNVYGYATVGADGTLAYTDGDGAVLATYEPTEEAAFCR